jgi:hypothetical protein
MEDFLRDLATTLSVAAQRRIGHGETARDAFDDALAEFRAVLPAAE